MDIASIGLDINSRGLQQGITRMRQLEGEGGRAERSMQRVGGAAKAMGAAIVAAAGGASFARIIRETASFEDAMLGLQAVSGATADQMRRLEAQARTLGATSMFSAQQAGEAQRFLAMAGFEVNEVLSATPGVLNLATAASIDLGRAADIASNVLGGFRLEVDQLNRVNDVLAATAAGSNTSIDQLGEALSYAAPIAAAAGVSIEETAAAIGTLSDAGLQASRAGTGILGFIRQLSNLTPNATAALESYGLTAEQVNIESEGLSVVLERLQKANINTADAFRIFGSEAGPAAQILAAGAQRVDEFTGSLRNAEGAADRAALIIGSGLTGSMRGFNSMVSESILQLGESGLAGAFGNAVDAATGLLAVYNGMLPEFAEANKLTAEQTQNLQRNADLLRITTTVALGATSAFVAYRSAVVAATIAQTAFNVAVRANPLGLLATGIGAAAGGLYAFREELGLVDAPLRTSADALNDLSGRITGASKEMLAFEVAGFTAELVSLQTAANQAESSIAGMQEQIASGDLTGPQTRQLEAAIERQTRNLAETNAEIEARKIAIEQLNSQLKIQAAAEQDVVITLPEITSATREAAEATDTFANELESLRRSLDPAYARQQDLARATATLDQGLRTGAITLDQYLYLWDEAANKFIEAGRESEDLAETVIDGTDEMTREMERFGNAVDDVFVDAFKGAFDSFEDFADRLKNAFETLMAELAWAAVKNEIKIQLGMDTSGLMSGGISQLFGGGGGLNIGSLGSLGNTVSGWIGGGSAASGGLYAGANTGAVAGTLYGSANTGAAVGGLYGNAVTGGLAQTGIMSSISSGVATAMPWIGAGILADNVLGLGIVDGITKALDGLFGSKKTFDFDFQQGGNFGVFGDRESAFGEFGTTSFSDFKLDQQPELDAMLNGIVQLDNALAAAAIPERFDAMKAAIEGFTHSGPEKLVESRLRTMIEGSGALGAEALLQIADPQAMAAAFLQVVELENIGTRLGGQIINDIADEFERTGNVTSAANQMMRAAQTAGLLADSSERLNLQFDVAASGAIHAASALNEMVGGVENLAALQSSYYQTYFTEAERAANLQDDLTASLSALGLELPSSRDGFRELVEAQDLNTEAGQQNYATLLQLAGGFDQLQTSMASIDLGGIDLSGVRSAWGAFTDSIENEQEILKRAYDAQRGSIQTNIRTIQSGIRDTEQMANRFSSAMGQMLGSALAINQRARFSSGQAYLQSVLAGGGMGDPDAIDSALAAVANPSEATYQTLEEYQRDFLSTASVISQLNERAEDQLTTEERSLRAMEGMLDDAERQYQLELRALERQEEQQARLLEAQFGTQSWLSTVNGSVLTVAEAISQLDLAAKQAQKQSSRDPIAQAYRDILGRDPDESGYAYYAGSGFSASEIRARLRDSDEATGRIPGFANGGTHSGGWRMVGERGPELEWTPPSRIMSNSSMGNNLNTEAVRQSVDAMSNRLDSVLRGILNASTETASIMDDWDTLGQPGVRNVTA